MPQKTELDLPESVSPSAKPAADETHSAAAAPPARSQGFFRLHPRAPMILAIAFVVLLVGGYFAYQYFSSYESTDDAEVDG
ncbi:MAG: hypothetical protein WB621_11690, partial [Candidatus Acidiferrales bacterium]